MASLREKFRPKLHVHAMVDIDLTLLHEQGFEALLLDLDNTMLPWKDSNIPESSRLWIETAKKLGLKPCIVSNTHYPKRLNRISSELDIPAVARALKPRSYGFESAAKMLGCEIERMVVVGDQLLTDILGGNMVGAYTILVDPMHPREFIGTKVSRLVELAIFRMLRTPARLGTKSDSTKSEKRDTK